MYYNIINNYFFKNYYAIYYYYLLKLSKAIKKYIYKIIFFKFLHMLLIDSYLVISSDLYKSIRFSLYSCLSFVFLSFYFENFNVIQNESLFFFG